MANLNLRSAAGYAILAAAGITNTGSTTVGGGAIGSFPTATIIGFPPGEATIDNGDAQAALADALSLYNALSALTFTSLGTAVNLSTSGLAGGNVYNAGNYSSTSSMSMSTGIVLDAQGNPNAQFIFKAVSTVNLAAGQAVTLVNGAQAQNVIWLVGSSLTTVATSTFVGTILANTSITLGGGVLNGRALAGVVTSSGAVTIAAATVITAPAQSPSSGQGVFNISGNAGLGNITVQCAPQNFDSLNPKILFTASDAFGSFSFAGLVPGNYTITAQASDNIHIYRHKAGVTIGSSDQVVNLTPQLINSSNSSVLTN
jgi:hypothetical protein